jgi:hypothetical protein
LPPSASISERDELRGITSCSRASLTTTPRTGKTLAPDLFGHAFSRNSLWCIEQAALRYCATLFAVARIPRRVVWPGMGFLQYDAVYYVFNRHP